MTWWLWLLLVLAALGLYALLGLGLWRRGKALLAELGELSRVAERLADITDTEPPAPIVPAYLAGPGELAEVRQARRENLRARRERRTARGRLAVDRWHRLGLR